MNDPAKGRTDELPPWADRWLDGLCGCGSPLVEVHDMTGASQTVCKASGWDNMMHERPCARENADVLVAPYLDGLPAPCPCKRIPFDHTTAAAHPENTDGGERG